MMCRLRREQCAAEANEKGEKGLNGEMSVDEAAIQRVVDLCVREIRAAGFKASGLDRTAKETAEKERFAGGGRNAEERTRPQDEKNAKKNSKRELISAFVVQDAAKAGKREIRMSGTAIVTPLARDEARAKGIRLVAEGPRPDEGDGDSDAG
jgi:hypothetical protein